MEGDFRRLGVNGKNWELTRGNDGKKIRNKQIIEIVFKLGEGIESNYFWDRRN